MSRKPVDKFKTQPDNRTKFAFGRENYILMLIGLAVIMTGLIVMSIDKEPYGFGFLGLTLGPVVLMSGFIIEFFAILRNPNRDKSA